MSKKSSTKHPKMREVTVIFTNGQKMNFMMSAARYDKDVLHLQSDVLTHRAWKKDGKIDIIGEAEKKVARKFVKFEA